MSINDLLTYDQLELFLNFVQNNEFLNINNDGIIIKSRESYTLTSDETYISISYNKKSRWTLYFTVEFEATHFFNTESSFQMCFDYFEETLDTLVKFDEHEICFDYIYEGCKDNPEVHLKIVNSETL